MRIDTLDKDIDRAQRTADTARVTREDLRWSTKPGDRDRQRQIERQLEAITDAMRPIRSYIGGLVRYPELRRYENRLRKVSRALQYERKQLKKMRR